MDSIWSEAAKKPDFSSLYGDISTDVLIVGGGLAGVLCAHMLQESNINYTLIEANEICSGITKNTTAKVTFQHGLIYDKIINRYGTEAARKYYRANDSALSRYRDLCERLDCEFDNTCAYVYSRNNYSEIEKESKAYRRIGIKAELVRDLSLPFSVQGAVKVPNQGQIHPLRFLYKLSKGLNIKENTKLVNLSPHCAQTDKGKIYFSKAIFTTHFPILNKHGFYFLKMYQHRSYVIALENAPLTDGMYVDADLKGLSFRRFGDLLLLGGGGHRTGKQGGCYRELEAFAKVHYPNAVIKYRFATQDCMSLDGMPYIGLYSKSTPDLFVATGFNKWGFTSAMAAAEILCDMIKGTENRYADLFDPSRSILHPQLAVNGTESVLNLLTPTVPRCPHLGCALKYNKFEHSWDCPCHGSRFTEAGQLIDGPATDDMAR